MFRFSVRELLLLTVIAALAVGWWLDIHRNEALRLQNKADVVKRGNAAYAALIKEMQSDVRMAKHRIKTAAP